MSGDTIAAVATGGGGALAVIRVSGPMAIDICEGVFGGEFSGAKVFFRRVKELDDVVVTVFRAPKSYTGEDVVEISCHGSRFVQQKIMQLLVDHGVRLAEAGEFTMRALMNGKMDLAQAEAVADLIAAEDRAAHDVALKQLRGGFSNELAGLREELVGVAALMELELDFGDEDVEFADRRRLEMLLGDAREKIERLRCSFAAGNAMKNGISVAIVGRPNVGKSTLLNALLGDNRAIVSDIAGTTRDTLEESVVIDGVRFRFVDTAGVRETDDRLEQMGIERTRQAVERADVVLVMIEAGSPMPEVNFSARQRVCLVVNKIDRAIAYFEAAVYPTLHISALRGDGLEELKTWLTEGVEHDDGVVVSSARHYEALTHAAEALERVSIGLADAKTADLLTLDIREALHYLGLITGEVTTDDLLHDIFSKFCIGK